MKAIRLRSARSASWVLSATLALTIAMLIPSKADAAFVAFSNGVLTVNASEGKVVPRCAADGEITVTGVLVEAYCRDLRRIEAFSIVAATFDFSQLPDNLGGGQGPIEIHATSKVTDPLDFTDDKFIGAPGHVNVFSGGLGSDSLIGGNLNDTLNGGADSDKVAGGGGNDVLFGGPAGDKLLGGPGRDTLKGGGGSDKLVGGPGRDAERQ